MHTQLVGRCLFTLTHAQSLRLPHPLFELAAGKEAELFVLQPLQDRETERERESVCVCVRVRETERVWERERDGQEDRSGELQV